VLQRVAVCCSVLQSAYLVVMDDREGVLYCIFVAMCCSVLQRVAVCCSTLQCVAVCCSVLQCVAVCCSVLQSAYLVVMDDRKSVSTSSVLQCVAVCCSALQCVAVRCSALQLAYLVVMDDRESVSISSLCCPCAILSTNGSEVRPGCQKVCVCVRESVIYICTYVYMYIDL